MAAKHLTALLLLAPLALLAVLHATGQNAPDPADPAAPGRTQTSSATAGPTTPPPCGVSSPRPAGPKTGAPPRVCWCCPRATSASPNPSS